MLWCSLEWNVTFANFLINGNKFPAVHQSCFLSEMMCNEGTILMSNTAVILFTFESAPWWSNGDNRYTCLTLTTFTLYRCVIAYHNDWWDRLNSIITPCSTIYCILLMLQICDEAIVIEYYYSMTWCVY